MPTSSITCVCRLYFMRRFWNHTLTWRSVRSRDAAISIRRGRHRYLLKWNSFSSSSSCVFVYAVRRRRLPLLPEFPEPEVTFPAFPRLPPLTEFGEKSEDRQKNQITTWYPVHKYLFSILWYNWPSVSLSSKPQPTVF